MPSSPMPRVLFVDDEPRVLDGLRRGLSSRRAEWTMAFLTDPIAAVKAHQALAFDVVVSDIAMPGMGGLEMVSAMRQSAPGGIYIILTGTADLNVAVDAINKASVFRFFTKPCAAHLIAEGISAGLEDTRRRTSASNSVPSASKASDLTGALGLAALNRISLGVIVVDHQARMLFTNRAGGTLLSQRDGVLLGANGICRTSDPAECKQLHELVRLVCESSPIEGTSTIAVSRPSKTRPLTVLVTPLLAREPEQPLAALYIADQESMPLPSAAAIERLFDLTPTQSRLVRALVEGSNLEDAAKNCAVTISTARTYLKQIFAKTNTNRQSELLKLVLTTPVIA